MPEFVNKKKVQLAVKSGFDRHRRFCRSRVAGIKQYVGHQYRGEGQIGSEPINLIFHVIRSLVPTLIMRNPINKVTTENTMYSDYAYLLGLGLDLLNKQMDLKTIVRRAIVDAMFCMGIVKTGLSASEELYDFGDVTLDNGTIYHRNVDFDDFVADPTCTTWDEAAFIGHRSRVPRQLLLDDDSCDHDLIMRLPQSVHEDAKNKATRLSQGGMSSQEMIELQDFVDVVELYIKEANATILIPDPAQLITPDYIKIEDYIGPKSGPLRFLSFTQPVPGNPYPVAPVGIWYDLHIMANRLMVKQMDRSEAQKSLIVVDPGSAEMGDDLRDEPDGSVILGDPTTATTLSTLGAERGTSETLNNLQVWFNYMSGNPDQQAGIASDANTATQATILNANANVTVEDSRGMLNDFVRGLNRDAAWYIHYDPMLDMTLTVKRRDWYSVDKGMLNKTVRLTSSQRRGDHWDYTFDLKARSMTPVDPIILTKRVIEFGTSVVPSMVAAAYQATMMGVPFNLRASLTSLAEQLDIADIVSEWFDDPEYMNRIALMVQMGPKADGGPKGAGIAGVMQNGGSPLAGDTKKNPLNQMAQEPSGQAQSAMRGSTPGSLGGGF